jgi:uncharacterized protein YbaR (Trm112 family)/SAM-dependent methyltransferase
MNAQLNDILCCPECRHAPLDLTVIETAGDEIETGYLRCGGCERFYFVDEGVPRMIAEEFGPLIDHEFPARHAEAFAPHAGEVERYLASMDEAQATTGAVWSMEDVRFWEEEYSEEAYQQEVLAKVGKAKHNAGQRLYPRDRTIFRHLRPRLQQGGAVVDMGCGFSQTFRSLCSPETIPYTYVGADLALAALLANRRTLRGQFVQCSAEKPPFRDGAVDAVVMLGTLHHLSDSESALVANLRTIRPGGLLGFHDVISRGGVGKKRSFLAKSHPESAHNESIDLERITRRLDAMAITRERRLGYSPLRWVLIRLLGEAMRSRPLLTRAVFAADWLVVNSLGRFIGFFGPREVVVLAERKADAGVVRPAPAESLV